MPAEAPVTATTVPVRSRGCMRVMATTLATRRAPRPVGASGGRGPRTVRSGPPPADPTRVTTLAAGSAGAPGALRRLAAHVRRLEPLAWQSVALGLVCSVVLEVLLVPGEVFRPERTGWLRACQVSFLVFAAVALLRGRVGRTGLRLQMAEAVVMIVVVGTSTTDVGVVAACVITVALVLVNGASHLGLRELVGVVGLCAVAVALLLTGQGVGGTALAPAVLTVTALGAVPAGVVWTLRRRLETAVAEAERVSRHDPLTGLLNRHGLAVAAPALVAAAAGRGAEVGVLVLDVDHFKTVNDGHGHAVGDEVLRALAGVVRATARGGDLVARLGGEEMCLVVVCGGPGGGRAELAALGERLRAGVAAAGTRPAVTVSVGGACLRPAAHDEPEQLVLRLVEQADGPLYEVKRSGRDGVRVLEA